MRGKLTLTEAISRLLWHLMHGEAMTNQQAAELTGYTRSGVYRLLCRMSRDVAITQDEKGFWYLIDAKSPD